MNRKLKISLYLVAIFIAGVFTGVFISYQVARHMMPNSERIAARWCGELEAKLSLTPEQMGTIRPMVVKALEDFKQDMFNQTVVSLSNCYTLVSLELSPEQQVKLRQLQEEQQSFFRSQFDGKPSQPHHD
jgi:hypothetical protein